ncbi:Choline transporter-like protein 5 [Phytophthora citrophthora]|uniref:Choline transporter-like protein 5 n=1 Tax=Phytophthora citrophthora TaxID=4793 RepID=A0AAD9GY37_9STRA|nr:Choline transporter-like protein 5 [Phytophthora citrophthora]
MGNRGSQPKEADEAPDETRQASQPSGQVVGNNPFKPNDRGCTDILCLLLFVVFWIGMIIIAGVGYKHGKPQRLIYGTDWMGRTCGAQADKTDNVPAYDFTDYKYMIYPRLSEDLLTLGITDSKQLMKTSTLKKLFGVCVKSCPLLTDAPNGEDLYVHAYLDYEMHALPVNEDAVSAGASMEYVRAGSPWKLITNSSNVLYRCVELTEITTTQTARCIDDCTASEEAAYHPGKPLTCGTNETTNPFRDCGSTTCAKMITSLRPNCTSLETTKEERQIGAATDDPITKTLSRKWHMVARWLGDLQKAALPILICGGLFALVLGLFWLVMLRFCAGLFVWLVIVFVVAMQIVVTVFCAYEGNLINSTSMQSTLDGMGMSTENAEALTAATTTYIASAGISAAEDQAHYWAIACYVLTAVDIALFILLIFMCGRIRIAIGIIREASKALQSMPMLVLYPIIPTLFAVGLVAYWLVAAAFIATSGNISLADVANSTSTATGADVGSVVPVQMQDNDAMHNLMIYHLFGLLWTSQFIQAAAYATIAGAFCEYYWTLDKRQVPARPVLRSMWRTVRYHFGSVAFGSLIIAILQFARITLEYVDQKMRSAKQGNAVVRVAMMCLKCLLWCFEKCLKFLNNNAFIIMAMKGKSFCPSMKDSFSLLLANAARVATVSIIARFLMLLGKIFITGFCMLFMFVFIRYPPSHTPSFFMGDLSSVSSPIFPMLLTGVLSYATASFFLDVYGTGIDTILLCFCEDCNVNKTSEQYYMSDELVAFIEGPAKHNAFSVYQSQSASNAVPATAPPVFQPHTVPMNKTK